MFDVSKNTNNQPCGLHFLFYQRHIPFCSVKCVVVVVLVPLSTIYSENKNYDIKQLKRTSNHT